MHFAISWTLQIVSPTVLGFQPWPELWKDLSLGYQLRKRFQRLRHLRFPSCWPWSGAPGFSKCSRLVGRGAIWVKWSKQWGDMGELPKFFASGGIVTKGNSGNWYIIWKVNSRNSGLNLKNTLYTLCLVSLFKSFSGYLHFYVFIIGTSQICLTIGQTLPEDKI